MKQCFHFIKLKHCFESVAFGKRFTAFVLLIYGSVMQEGLNGVVAFTVND